MGTKPVVLALAVLAVGYGVYPYVVLHRLGAAVESGDAFAIEPRVEWQAVRQGFKDDLSGWLAAELVESGGEGYRFLEGALENKRLADGLVDAFISPHGMAALLDGGRRMPEVDWAFFEGATSFRAVLRLPNPALEDRRFSISMELIGGSWKLTRIMVPEEVFRKGF